MSLYIIYGLGFIGILYERKFKIKSYYSLYAFLVILALFNSLGLSLISGKIYFGEIIEVTLPLILLLFGYFNTLSDRQFDKTISSYIFIVFCLGMFLIFYYGSGFEITQIYFFGSKNQVGPMIFGSAVVALIKLADLIETQYKKRSLFFYILILFSCVVFGLVLRNRSGLLGFAIVAIIYLLNKFSKISYKRILYINIAMFGIIGLYFYGVFDGVIEIVEKALFFNYDLTNIDSISAGRVRVYKWALEFLNSSPILGEVLIDSNIETPHNYLLNLWLKFGYFGMLPITILYFSLWIKVLKGILKRRTNLGIYLMLLALIVSFLEPTYPFGPLSAQSLTWFCFGKYLSEYKE